MGLIEEALAFTGLTIAMLVIRCGVTESRTTLEGTKIAPKCIKAGGMKESGMIIHAAAMEQLPLFFVKNPWHTDERADFLLPTVEIKK